MTMAQLREVHMMNVNSMAPGGARKQTGSVLPGFVCVPVPLFEFSSRASARTSSRSSRSSSSTFGLVKRPSRR